MRVGKGAWHAAARKCGVRSGKPIPCQAGKDARWFRSSDRLTPKSDRQPGSAPPFDYNVYIRHLFAWAFASETPASAVGQGNRRCQKRRVGVEKIRWRGTLSLLMAEPCLKDLLHSHSELRAALVLAGKRIRKLNFGRVDDPVLPILRWTLRESRLVARGFRSSRQTEA
jgi:hypothetical protein